MPIWRAGSPSSMSQGRSTTAQKSRFFTAVPIHLQERSVLSLLLWAWWTDHRRPNPSSHLLTTRIDRYSLLCSSTPSVNDYPHRMQNRPRQRMKQAPTWNGSFLHSSRTTLFLFLSHRCRNSFLQRLSLIAPELSAPQDNKQKVP